MENLSLFKPHIKQVESAPCASCEVIHPQWQPQKCCTFQPSVVNFLVGWSLVYSTPFIKNQIQKQIEKGLGTPLGIIVDPSYLNAYRNQKINQHSHVAEFLCPYFLTGNNLSCGLGKGRPHPCIGYQCQGFESDHWDQIRENMNHWEQEWAQLALLERGYLDYELDQCLNIWNGAMIGSRFTDEELKALWAPSQSSSIEEFYKQCYQWASTQWDRESNE